MDSVINQSQSTFAWIKQLFPVKGLRIDMDAWRSRNIDGDMPISFAEFCLLVTSPENSTDGTADILIDNNALIQQGVKDLCHGHAKELYASLKSKVEQHYQQHAQELSKRLDIAQSLDQ